MAKNDNLQDFLTDVADAIRAKKGTTDKINPLNFSAEIRNLSGQEPTVEIQGEGDGKWVEFTGAWYNNCVHKVVIDNAVVDLPSAGMSYNSFVKYYGASYLDGGILSNITTLRLYLTNVNRICKYAVRDINLTHLYLHNINHIDPATFYNLQELSLVLITGNNPDISDESFLALRSSGVLLVDELNFKNKKLLSKFVGWRLYVFTPDGKNLNYKGIIIQGHAIY